MDCSTRIALSTAALLASFGLILTAGSFAQTDMNGSAEAIAGMAKPGCELPPRKPKEYAKYMEKLIADYGGADFMDPPEVHPTTEGAQHDLVVKYSTNTHAGCEVNLRSYNGKLVGETIRASPGDTLYIRLDNQLPEVTNVDHPQQPPPSEHVDHFSFNLTNLHTHGLHTSPEGQSDNVFLEVGPDEEQLYRVAIPKNHPSGTFWYHAHLHGSTAMQLSSGMAGALIVEGGMDANGGLDAVPEIAAARDSEKIFVLQQLSYGEDGKLEDFKEALPNRKWRRPLTVNGQLVPVIHMRPGEVQRWRFIHAGVEENISLVLDGHVLHEIAADGIALGRIVGWPASEKTSFDVQTLLLSPGNRADVLVKAGQLPQGTASQEFLLRDEKLPVRASLIAAAEMLELAQRRTVLDLFTAADLLDRIADRPDRVVARIVVEGDPVDMELPGSAELSDRVPSELKPITDDELTGEAQVAKLTIADRICEQDGSCLEACALDQAGCATRFLIGDYLYSSSRVRTLKLDTSSEWTLSGNLSQHPFHVHVNPFQVEREEPDDTGALVKRLVWKDTVLLPADGSEVTIRSRYTQFTGKFVLHCHILSHEDMGMMEAVEIVN